MKPVEFVVTQSKTVDFVRYPGLAAIIRAYYRLNKAKRNAKGV